MKSQILHQPPLHNLLFQAVAITMAQNLKADIKAQRAKWLE